MLAPFANASRASGGIPPRLYTHGGHAAEAPLFGNRAILPQLKFGLTLLVSLLVFPVGNARGIALPPGLISWALGIGGEVLLGITIGLMVRFILAAVSMAGQLIGLEVGLSTPALFNLAFEG